MLAVEIVHQLRTSLTRFQHFCLQKVGTEPHSCDAVPFVSDGNEQDEATATSGLVRANSPPPAQAEAVRAQVGLQVGPDQGRRQVCQEEQEVLSGV
jgi:hypothetical protein